jgi:hypothetical protein
MQINNLEAILEDEGIVFLTYGGLLTQSLISGMTDALEQESQVNDMSMKVSHNLLTIFIELSQNMMNYSKNSSLQDKALNSKGLIIVGYDKNSDSYYILSRNILDKKDKEKITPKIEQVLPLNKDELKTLYRELRKSGKGKHEKGAGLGFVEVARRCDKMEYSFSKINDSSYYYFFKAIIKNL